MPKRPTPVHHRDRAGKFTAHTNTAPETKLEDYRIARPEYAREKLAAAQGDFAETFGLTTTQSPAPRPDRSNRMKNLIKAATEFFENELANELNRAEIAAQVEAIEINSHLIAVTGSQEEANKVIAMAAELAKCGIQGDEISDLMVLHYRMKHRGIGIRDLDNLIRIKRIIEGAG